MPDRNEIAYIWELFCTSDCASPTYSINVQCNCFINVAAFSELTLSHPFVFQLPFLYDEKKKKKVQRRMNEKRAEEERGSGNSLLRWVVNYGPFWAARSPAFAKGTKHTRAQSSVRRGG